jgi:hypothetical protein
MMSRKRFFKRHIREFLENSIIKDKKVLVVSYGEVGELISALRPSKGVELVSQGLGEKAKSELEGKYKNIEFINSDFLNYHTEEKFDYIIFQEYLNYEDNLYDVFIKIKSLINKDSKIFIFGVNPHSILLIRVLKHLGLLTPKIERNILHLADIENLLNISGFEVLDKGYRFLFPFRLFGLGDFFNAIVCRIPFLRLFCFGQFIVFRALPKEGGRRAYPLL